MYLYHATPKYNKKSILKDGIKIGRQSNWDGMEMHNAIYFAFSPEAAEDYVAEADNYNNDDIVIFKVDASKLNLDYIGYDYNNHCETIDYINSMAYFKDVPPELLSIATKNDKSYEFYELEGRRDPSANKIFKRIALEYYEDCRDWWGSMDDEWGDYLYEYGF